VPEINDKWPIATYGMEPDGWMSFTCDDGDTGRMAPDGASRWISER
jgi:hypothetical protein